MGRNPILLLFRVLFLVPILARLKSALLYSIVRFNLQVLSRSIATMGFSPFLFLYCVSRGRILFISSLTIL